MKKALEFLKKRNSTGVVPKVRPAGLQRGPVVHGICGTESDPAPCHCNCQCICGAPCA